MHHLPEPDPSDPPTSEKSLMFLGFLARFGLWITGALFLRAVFFTLTGENIIQEGRGSYLPRHGL